MTPPPSPAWQRALFEAPLLDVHEHHIPSVFLSDQVHLLTLFQQSYAGWTVERPYPLPSENREEPPMESALTPVDWSALTPYLEERRSNHFVRNLVSGILHVHGDPDWTDIDRDNWEALNDRILQSRKQPGFQTNTLKQAGVERVITDDYTNPLLVAKDALGESYQSVMRINAFACGWHPEARDHNGNSAAKLLKQAGMEPDTFEEYIEALTVLARQMESRGQVAFKNALAYDRTIAFEAPNAQLAKQAWGKTNPKEAERLAFGDYVVDHICKLAAEMNIPVQTHLGTGIIRDSHPMNIAGLIERHPRTRFLLMHLAYPWSRDLLGLAFVYRNIWIDLTWSWLLSPTHFKSAFHEAIEILSDEGRMMLGGDNWHVEETCGTLRTFRRLMIETFEEKISSGYFTEKEALRLGNRILHSNARQFFKLK